jgi:hypothetical protein
MSSKPVEPQLGAESFSCPHCGAFAHQFFHRAFVKVYEPGKSPEVLRIDERIAKVKISLELDQDEAEKRKGQLQFLERLEKHALTYAETGQYGEECHREMVNLALSMCFSCKGFAEPASGICTGR